MTATVVDENGVIVPDAADSVNFNISGAGTIAAVDSGDNTDTGKFQDTKRKAYQGKVFAYIKANKNSGKITISAQSGNLKSNMLNLNVK